MAFRSTGWNDCPPILDIAPSSAKRSIKRNQSGTHINSLNNGLTNTSSSKDTTYSGNINSEKISENSISDKEIMEKLLDVLCIPSGLSTREFAHYSRKLKSGIPTALKVKDANVDHRAFIDNVLSDILELRDGIGKESLTECRSLVINYMLVNPGVVGWALPLRKLIESLRIPG